MPDHPVGSELEPLPPPRSHRSACFAPRSPPCATGGTWARAPRSFRLGRRVVYRLADVRAWIEAQDHRDDS